MIYTYLDIFFTPQVWDGITAELSFTIHASCSNSPCFDFHREVRPSQFSGISRFLKTNGKIYGTVEEEEEICNFLLNFFRAYIYWLAETREVLRIFVRKPDTCLSPTWVRRLEYLSDDFLCEIE